MRICDRCRLAPSQECSIPLVAFTEAMRGRTMSHSEMLSVDLCDPCMADYAATVKRWLEPLPQVKP